MPVFKVWNSSRTLKRSVVASSVAEVIENGRRKLGLPEVETTLILEEDGTLIDEDEILAEFASKVFLLLTPGEIWTPHSMEQNTTNTVPITDSNPGDFNSPVTQRTPASIDSPLASVLTTPGTDSHQHVMDAHTPGTIAMVTQGIVTTDLPAFSHLVVLHIEGTTAIPERIWSVMISEAAHYYMAKFPELGDQQHYRAIGMKMFRRYPSIGLEGQNPWSAFNKSLSQKIRHLRLSLKMKSQKGTSNGPPTKKKCFKVLTYAEVAPTVVDSEDDVKRHIEELKSEWGKAPKSRNLPHIKHLLKRTRGDRVEFLTKNSSGSISPLFARYPCFEDGYIVLHEFGLMVGNERVRKIATNMKKVLFGVEELDGIEVPDHNDPLRMLAVIKSIEKRTKWHQGGGKSKAAHSIIQVKHDVADDDIRKELTTKELEAPHVVVFLASGELQAVFLVADTVFSEVEKKGGLMAAILKLVAMYYIFDLDYPRTNSMVMAVLQTIVMEEPYKKDSSKGYKVFVKELRKIIDCLPQPDENDEALEIN